MSRIRENTKQTITKGVLFCTPFVLFFGAVLCLVLWFNVYFLNASPASTYVNLLFAGARADGTIQAQEATRIEAEEVQGDVIYGEFQTPPYASQWATMNVDGWEEKDIPVYYGNSAEILRSGAAQAQFSRFCGQNGKVVLSAHVNLEFFEIEDSAARFEAGEEVLVTLDTLWGKYVYRVTETVIFGHRDPAPLFAEGGSETLFFYTCYPRENAFAYKTERIGLKCELVEGATWEEYLNA